MPKIIIGLVGEIAAGKDTVAEYLSQKYQAQTISFSQPIRDILDRLYLPQSRINMMTLGNTLREAFGQDLFSKTISREVKESSAEIIILPNIRLESDLAFLDSEPGFILVSILADQKIRFKRLTNRRQNPDDQTKTWEQFLADSNLNTEIHIRELAGQATHQIDNNGTKDELYRQIEQLLSQLKKG